MINKYEATGIFLSIAVLALILAFFRFDTLGTPEIVKTQTNSQGAVVVTAGEDGDSEAALADAFIEASSAGGELERLVINDIRIGDGNIEVAEGDTLTVHYIGRTQGGVQFDSSYLRGEPFVFTVGEGRVIQGWEEGLIGMRVGGQRILVIPPSMGYGNVQVGPLEANTTLVFAVELLEIN